MQQSISRQFREFKSSALILKQRLERSSRPEEKEHAAILGYVLDKVGNDAIVVDCDRLVDLLKSKKLNNTNDLREAVERAKVLADKLKLYSDILRENVSAAKLREEINVISEVKKLEVSSRIGLVVRTLNQGLDSHSEIHEKEFPKAKALLIGNAGWEAPNGDAKVQDRQFELTYAKLVAEVIELERKQRQLADLLNVRLQASVRQMLEEIEGLTPKK
jgi:hypothetical protein